MRLVGIGSGPLKPLRMVQVSRTDIELLKSMAESREVDLGPLGGCETFVPSSAMVVSRDLLAEVCAIAIKALEVEERELARAAAVSLRSK